MVNDMLGKAAAALHQLWNAPERRPWLEGALIAWTMIMLAIILLALVPGTASEPVSIKSDELAVALQAADPVPDSPPTPERVTFRERWAPVSLPAIPGEIVTPLALVAPGPPQEVPEQIRIVPRKAERKQKAEARGGLCARHGLRQVWVSSTRWRCKR